MNSEDDSVTELMQAQIDSQGVGVVSVKDGTVFMLTTKTLEYLLDQAKKGKEQTAVVFIKHQRLS